MQICIEGLWHLGTVIAACVAEQFSTRAHDPDPRVIGSLKEGRPPVLEPGLPELLQAGLKSGQLMFTNDLGDAVKGAEVVWVAFDTPVDEEDIGDTDFVARQVASLFPQLADGALVLISSQVKVGFTAQMEREFRSKRGDATRVTFAYSPENLRLGAALDTFRHTERVVIGTNHAEDRERLSRLFSPFCQRIEWMSVESAEMTKHALNSFLATSIAFANEIAVLCERVGADAKEVERGLKSDARIGSRAYLSPGRPFSGGTLGRDLDALVRIAERLHTPTPLIASVRISNEEHKKWARQTLMRLLGRLEGKIVAVLGLTYKSSTDTLRRSDALELCTWLVNNGARAVAHDPVIAQLPPKLSAGIQLVASPRLAFRDADATVIATDWPVFKEITAASILENMKSPMVIDPNRFLADTLGSDPRLSYFGVGMPGGHR